MSNTADTNQASEDELKTKAPDSSSEAGYPIIPELYEYCLGVGLELSNYQAIELTKLIRGITRTEKLKLLAEVRERVVGEDVLAYDTPDITPHLLDLMECQNQLRVEQRAELAKLEAEL